MPNISASIPDQLKGWVDLQIETGKYASTSDYLRDLIRNDQKQAEQIDALLLEGINSGPDIKVSKAYWKNKKQALMQSE
jgi:antitoxin ParD1/3/4